MVIAGAPGANVAARSSVTWTFGAGSLAGVPQHDGIADVEDRLVADLRHARQHLGDINAREQQPHAGGGFSGRDGQAAGSGRCARRHAVVLLRRRNRRGVGVGETNPERDSATLPDAHRSGPAEQLRPGVRLRPDAGEAAVGDARSGGRRAAGRERSPARDGQRRRALRKRGESESDDLQIRQRIRTGVSDINRIGHFERGRADDRRIAGPDFDGHALRRHRLVHIRGRVVRRRRIGHPARDALRLPYSRPTPAHRPPRLPARRTSRCRQPAG